MIVDEGTNVTGDVAARVDTLENQMDTFDALPPVIRRWVANARFSYDTRQARDIAIQCIGMPDIGVLIALEKYDQDYAAAMHKETYGA